MHEAPRHLEEAESNTMPTWKLTMAAMVRSEITDVLVETGSDAVGGGEARIPAADMAKKSEMLNSDDADAMRVATKLFRAALCVTDRPPIKQIVEFGL